MKVVNADTTAPVRKPGDNKDAFAVVPLGWAADVTEAMNNPGYMVFTLLAYLAWKTKSSTFVLSNDCLKLRRRSRRRASSLGAAGEGWRHPNRTSWSSRTDRDLAH